MLILQGGSTVEVTEVEKQWMSSEGCGTVAGVDTKLQPIAFLNYPQSIIAAGNRTNTKDLSSL